MFAKTTKIKPNLKTIMVTNPIIYCAVGTKESSSNGHWLIPDHSLHPELYKLAKEIRSLSPYRSFRKDHKIVKEQKPEDTAKMFNSILSNLEEHTKKLNTESFTVTKGKEGYSTAILETEDKTDRVGVCLGYLSVMLSISNDIYMKDPLSPVICKIGTEVALVVMPHRI